ncbi:MAG: bifunctional metallophosphatase/5'-nucleotidase [Bdellovibrionales bacterium]|nr:bifunctional metallophosphatase/5'-nucleotidase [Bdellovibrionales bacterium]
MQNSKRVIRAAALLTTLFLAACAGPGTQENPIPKSESASHPGSTDPNVEMLVIFGTNDIHGALGPQNLKTKEADGSSGTSYSRGGLSYLSSHIKILRQEHGNRLLLLDGGDQFQGSIESNSKKGAPITAWMNLSGYTAASIGNHEFDFGQEALQERMKEAQFPYLAANIREKSTGKLPNFPNLKPSTIVQAGRLKVGLIGLTTRDTPVATVPTNVKNLEFLSLADTTKREAKKLRDQGAQVVLVVTHAGVRCDTGPFPRNLIRKPSDPQTECDPQDEVYELLKTVPKGTVDGVVAGHSHTIVHHYLNGTPVIQSGSRAGQFHLMYLFYDLKAGKLLSDQTQIEGPIPVCPEIFKNQRDCQGDRPAPKAGRGGLVKSVFRGVSIEADLAADQLLAPHFADAEALKKTVVGHADRAIEHSRTTEAALGNLVTDAMLSATQADVALVNPGGLRAPIGSGDITYGDVFQTLPFENSVSLLDVSGKELNRILQVAESGARGLFPIAGMQVDLVDLKHEVAGKDLDKNGKVEPWEVDRLIRIKDRSGNPIKDQKRYKLATIDFLVQGGDNMGWAFNQVPKDKVTMNHSGFIRDVVIEYLKKNNPINSTGKPLVSSASPRIRLLPPQAPAARGRAKGKKRK